MYQKTGKVVTSSAVFGLELLQMGTGNRKEQKGELFGRGGGLGKGQENKETSILPRGSILLDRREEKGSPAELGKKGAGSRTKTLTQRKKKDRVYRFLSGREQEGGAKSTGQGSPHCEITRTVGPNPHNKGLAMGLQDGGQIIGSVGR